MKKRTVFCGVAERERERLTSVHKHKHQPERFKHFINSTVLNRFRLRVTYRTLAANRLYSPINNGFCTFSQGLLVEGRLLQRRRFKLAHVLRQSVLAGHKRVCRENEREKRNGRHLMSTGINRVTFYSGLAETC